MVSRPMAELQVPHLGPWKATSACLGTGAEAQPLLWQPTRISMSPAMTPSSPRPHTPPPPVPWTASMRRRLACSSWPSSGPRTCRCSPTCPSGIRYARQGACKSAGLGAHTSLGRWLLEGHTAWGWWRLETPMPQSQRWSWARISGMWQ